MAKICSIEDSEVLQAIIKQELADLHEVHTAGTLKEATQLLAKINFDLILLDIMVPDGNGFDFCAQLRADPKFKTIPVIILTSKSDPIDKHLGFSLGADDYIVKPFEPLELRGRIAARLRNKPTTQLTGAPLIGPFKVDQMRQRVYLVENERENDLGFTPFEFKLFQFLLSHEGTLFDRKTLLQNVQEQSVHVSEANIYTHISAMRKKLGKKSSHLQCVPRVGYRFLKNT